MRLKGWRGDDASTVWLSGWTEIAFMPAVHMRLAEGTGGFSAAAFWVLMVAG